MNMIRLFLLILGFGIVVLGRFFQPISAHMQVILLLVGVVSLGIPHGAADLLVASTNATESQREFSPFRFFTLYLGLLTAFALMLWFFPALTSILFLLLSAYHFGETDLNQFKTESLIGKVFVTSYGLVILSVILLCHFEELQPLVQQFGFSVKNLALLSWIGEYRFMLMALFGSIFVICTFMFMRKKDSTKANQDQFFLPRLACLVFLLANMPMLLGFTFYFVMWHSVLSLKNIVFYLRQRKGFSQFSIVSKMFFYSLLAIAGIGVFGFVSYKFMDNSSLLSYLFAGLAVLTVPHLVVMQEMYHHLRMRKI